MSFMLAHLDNGWQVDQAILSEEDKAVVIRFGHDWDPSCMKMDETLFSIAEKVKNFAEKNRKSSKRSIKEVERRSKSLNDLLVGLECFSILFSNPWWAKTL